MSFFEFLKVEWPLIHESAAKVELTAKGDPQTSCIYARRALELLVDWIYEHDPSVSRPYRDDLSALIHEPSFKKLASDKLFTKANLIRKLGNKAVHDKKRVIAQDGVSVCRELFHVAYWFARNYARKGLPESNLAFDESKLPVYDPTKTAAIHDQAKKLLERFHENNEKLAAKEETIKARDAELAARDQELEELRQEIARIKAENEKVPDSHDYDEEETRDQYIDLLLREVGWKLDQKRDREFPVSGMPNKSGNGSVDYVLWGDDGRPLGLVEAKRFKRSAKDGKKEAKHYADCLEKQFGQRPVIFLSNGYQHFIWDDQEYPPREVQGFYSKDELGLLIQRRETKKSIAEAVINDAIVDRPYQHRAIRNVSHAFEKNRERKALLVMATGSGKTRVAGALVDLLIRCNWVRRVLFLADRKELVKQAVDSFKQHLPDLPPVNLLKEKDAEGRVYVSTYPTMMGLIEERTEETRKFSPGYFDLVIVDEAHRSIFSKYRVIFDYFDSLLVGLTATPKDEIDRNTYSIFDLESGVPTDAYQLEEAVKEEWLVPPHAVSVPLKYQRKGIRYDELSDEDKEEWDALDWEDGPPADGVVEAGKINKILFNTDTVDKMLQLLMEQGLYVEGGDKLGKTIIFARNVLHAEFIAERFDKHYPHHKGDFAQVIAYSVDYHETILEDFKKPDRLPQIAISVDMLDTGVDVPEVVNLVLFKPVHSKTKFWQMLGRGTRPCKNLFGPEQHKEFFQVFDYCQNFEFFNQQMDKADPKMGESLSSRLFKARLEVLASLPNDGPEEVKELEHGEESVHSVRHWLLTRLQGEVGALNTDNFVVRPHRKLVEKFTELGAWTELDPTKKQELETLAALPKEMASEPEEAKRFDLLTLRLQLSILKGDSSFILHQRKVRDIADALTEKTSIPMVKEQLPLISELLDDQWWQDVTVPMVERARKALRNLVGFIDKTSQRPIYTDFEDEMGEIEEVELAGLTLDDFKRFKEKSRHYLRKHLDHIAIHKLHNNKELTPTDLESLRQMLVESGQFEVENIERAIEESHGLGLFVRSLVGLNPAAVQEALKKFIRGKTLSGYQLHFLGHITDHLTRNGMLEPKRLYESPFSDVAPNGPEDLWDDVEVDSLIYLLQDVKRRAQEPRLPA